MTHRDERLAVTLEDRIKSPDPLVSDFEQDDGDKGGDEVTKAEDVTPKRSRKRKE